MARITGVRSHELAWLLHKYPAARKEWELYVGDLDEMRDALMPRTGEGSGFIDIVKGDLEKLDGTSP